MQRKLTREVQIGTVRIGGSHPVAIQSMTNTATADAAATAEQIARLAAAGCDIVRVAVPDMESARALSEIKKRISIPLVADIHFDWRLALAAVEAGVDKIRLNPGNIGSAARVRAVADACAERGIPIRIGVNGGSLEKELLEKYGGVTPAAMCESAEGHIRLLQDCGFDNICVSMKSSDVGMTIAANLAFSEKYDYPLHIGVTETGSPRIGMLKSAAGAGSLLALGVGDTIRVSLTDDPVAEIAAARDILRAADRCETGINLVSCPTCARTRFALIDTVRALEERLAPMKCRLTVAVMGCEVNGPGEAREADIGVAGAGRGEAVIFRRGEILRRIREADIIPEILREIEKITQEA
ncbi:MAG: flavodoxin-dependent (E)-4-hydroxy-3-methylbut-2-enyl-diphosphate synthase [Clostridia bacterium]|nr:flavodoxin-dependent (E)-4-hydroxy-3-methylbut-2-enyl-diphosphate synthase [Clostridia bacterium]